MRHKTISITRNSDVVVACANRHQQFFKEAYWPPMGKQHRPDSTAGTRWSPGDATGEAASGLGKCQTWPATRPPPSWWPAGSARPEDVPCCYAPHKQERLCPCARVSCPPPSPSLREKLTRAKSREARLDPELQAAFREPRCNASSLGLVARSAQAQASLRDSFESSTGRTGAPRTCAGSRWLRGG